MAILQDVTGAVRAYSHRKLSSAYSGACMSVRESDGGTLADIGFDGLYLDEAALLTHVGANNGTIARWYDQVDTADISNAAAGSQPILVSSGTILRDDSALSLASASFASRELNSSADGGWSLNSDDWTIIYSGALDSNANTRRLFQWTGAGETLRFRFNSVGTFDFFDGTNSTTVADGSPVGQHTIMFVGDVSESTCSYYLDNVLIGTATYTDAGGASTFNLGQGFSASGSWDGHVTEFVVYERALDASERSAWQTWATNESPAEGHRAGSREAWRYKRRMAAPRTGA